MKFLFGSDNNLSLFVDALSSHSEDADMDINHEEGIVSLPSPEVTRDILSAAQSLGAIPIWVQEVEGVSDQEISDSEWSESLAALEDRDSIFARLDDGPDPEDL